MSRLTFFAYSLIASLLAVLLSPAWLLALVFVPKLRAGFWQKCGWLPQSELSKLSTKSLIVIHAVSVGELNAAKPVIEWLQSLSEYQVLLTNTTRTGHDLAQKTFSELPCLYFPFDHPLSVYRWFHQLRPKAVFLMETEIWPTFAFIAKAHNLKTPRCRFAMPSAHETKLVMMNGRLSERSYSRYKSLKGFLKGILEQYDALWMQSEQDKMYILELGAPPEKAAVLGNLKFHTPCASEQKLQPDLNAFFTQAWPDKSIIVFASTHEGEEALFLDAYCALKQDFPELKAVFVPRHPERFESVTRLLAANDLALARRSQLESFDKKAMDLLLLDSMGELTSILPFITIACMGGSFVPVGGHNFLEPLQAGCQTIVGPYMSNFKEMTQQALIQKAIIQVHHQQALLESLKRLLDSTQQREDLKSAGQKFLSSQQHVLKAYQDAILEILNAH